MQTNKKEEEMNSFQKDMLSILFDLKENHHMTGIKAEIQTECITEKDILLLKNLAQKTKTDLTIKIGGCDAIKDIYDTKTIGANSIVVPMVESCYAAEKFIKTAKPVLNTGINKVKFFINIETISGFNCLEEILKSDFSNEICGVVFGRGDMTGSLKISKDEVDSEIILNYAKKIEDLTLKYNKEFIIGGGVTTNSLSFFKKLPLVSKFETRKIIFDAKAALSDKKADIGIIKAVKFELLWLENKKNIYGKIKNEEELRIKTLKSRCYNSIV